MNNFMIHYSRAVPVQLYGTGGFGNATHDLINKLTSEAPDYGTTLTLGQSPATITNYTQSPPLFMTVIEVLHPTIH